jgi:hypothetical protein
MPPTETPKNGPFAPFVALMGLLAFLIAVATGYDVNFLVFGQTGSGKTHTVFGPPGCMGRALESKSTELQPEHGILLRTALAVFDRVQAIVEDGSARCVLTVRERQPRTARLLGVGCGLLCMSARPQCVVPKAFPGLFWGLGFWAVMEGELSIIRV